jgi:hypothetical protein
LYVFQFIYLSSIISLYKSTAFRTWQPVRRIRAGFEIGGGNNINTAICVQAQTANIFARLFTFETGRLPLETEMFHRSCSASTLKEISFWKEIFAKWRKFEGNKFWRKCEGNSRRTKEIWRKKQNFAKIGNI